MACTRSWEPDVRAYDRLVDVSRTAPDWASGIIRSEEVRDRRTRLLGKALSERHQQLEWAIEPNLPPQQCPHHVSFLPQQADPRLRVSGNVQIGLADMPLFHADLLLLNHDSGLPLLMAGEGEVEGGVQSRRL